MTHETRVHTRRVRGTREAHIRYTGGTRHETRATLVAISQTRRPVLLFGEQMEVAEGRLATIVEVGVCADVWGAALGWTASWVVVGVLGVRKDNSQR